MKRYWPIILLGVFFTLQSISFSAPGDRVAYPTRPMHDRLSSSVHGKFSTSMRLATYSTNGRMSKEHYTKLQKIGEPTLLATGNVGDSNHVRFTKPYHALKLLGLDTSTTLAANGPVMGINDYSLATWARAGAYDTDFGFPWSTSLHRIDYAVKTAASLGMRNFRITIHFTNRDLLSTSINGATPLVISDSDGWEGMDRILELCRLYGMRVTAVFTPPLATDSGWGAHSGGSYDFTKLMNYWYLPFAAYVSQRYASYDDILLLQPANEIMTPFPPPHETDWVSFQTQMYDTIKLYSDIPVILSGAYHVLENDPDFGVPGFLDMLNAAGKMDKFDRCVDVHLYPNIPDNDAQVASVGRANLDPVLDLGSGAPEDVVEIIAKLDAYGRSDANVMIGEIGLFWEDGTLAKETASATDITATWNYYKGNPRIDSVNYFAMWGREFDEPENLITGIGGLVGQPGMGAIVDNSNKVVRDRAMIVSDERGRHVEAFKNWTTPSSTNITATATSYGDVNRFIFRRANGTPDSPTAVTANQVISNVGFRAHDGTNFSIANRASIEARAQENYTPTAQGTSLALTSTPNGTLLTQTRLVVEGGGNVAIGTILEPVPTAGAMLDVNGDIRSRADGYIFPDDTTQTTAAEFSMSTGPNLYAQFGDNTGGFYGANNFYLNSIGTYFHMKDIQLESPATEFWATINSKIPFPANTVLRGNAAGTALEASQITSTSSGVDIASGGLTVASTTAVPLVLNRAVDGAPATLYKKSYGSLASPTAITDAAAGLAVLQIQGAIGTGVFDSARTALRANTSEAWSNAAGATTGGWYWEILTRSPQTGQSTMNAPSVRMKISETGLITMSNGGGVPFGHQYMNDATGLTVTVSAANTWYEVDGTGTTFTAGQLKNVTQSDHYLVATTAGYYSIDYSMAVDTGVPGDEVAGTVMVNGTATETAHGHSTVPAGDSASTVAGVTILNLAANDQVSLAVLNHTGSGAGHHIVAHHAQLRMVYIGSP